MSPAGSKFADLAHTIDYLTITPFVAPTWIYVDRSMWPEDDV